MEHLSCFFCVCFFVDVLCLLFSLCLFVYGPRGEINKMNNVISLKVHKKNEFWAGRVLLVP